MLKDYLKPEYRDTPEAATIAAMFEVTDKKLRMTLKVPADVGDAITRFLKKATDPAYRFHRRTGGGRRSDAQYLTCLRKDATFFKFYFNKRYVRPAVPNFVVHHCHACGQRI